MLPRLTRVQSVTVRAVRRPRSYVRVAGPDAEDYLQRMLSNDVTAGELVPALLLTAKPFWDVSETQYGFDRFLAESYAAHRARRLFEEPPYERRQAAPAGNVPLPDLDYAREHERRRLLQRTQQAVSFISAPLGITAATLEVSIDGHRVDSMRARQPGGSEKSAEQFVGKLYQNVKVLDSGARGSLTTFTERGIGDVLISWENEAWLATRELGPDKFEIVTPSVSILAEPPVAVVDKVVDKRKTRELATAYLEYLYSPEGQDIAGRNFFRPRDKAAAAKYQSQFSKVELFTIDERFGGWKEAQAKHFAEGGEFDRMPRGGR